MKKKLLSSLPILIVGIVLGMIFVTKTTAYAEGTIRIKATEQVSINQDTDMGGLPSGKVGDAYSVQLEAEGGTAPYTWTYFLFDLPDGMTLSSTGLLSGTPTESVSGSITISVTDANGLSYSASFNFIIYEDSWVPNITTVFLPNACVGKPYSPNLNVNHATADLIDWSVKSGSLPTGVSLYQAGMWNAYLDGTPTEAGTYTFVLQAYSQLLDMYGTQEYTVVVSDTFDVSYALPKDDSYVYLGESLQFYANIGNDNVTWVVTGAHSANTTISESGLLTVGEDETSYYIYAQAKDKANPANTAYREVPISLHKRYTLTVENGNGTTTKRIVEGDTIYVYSDSVSGKKFTRWTLDKDSTPITIADPMSTYVLIIMPSGDVKIKANYLTLITTLSATITAPIDGQNVDKNVISGNSDAYTATIARIFYSGNIRNIDTLVYKTNGEYIFDLEFTAKEGYSIGLPRERTVTINGTTAASVGDYHRIQLTATAVPVMTYSVTVNSGGGTGEYEENATVTVTANSIEGKQFVKWTVVSGGVTLADANASTTTFTMPNAAVELTAEYRDVYTVSFHANEGGGTMANATNISGEYTLPDCTFTAPSGKQFQGWATSRNGTVIATKTYNVTDNVTLYAIWNHVHAYTQEIANQAFVATSATCTAPATYYKSCSCGEHGTETFINGTALGHDYQEVANSATPATCTADGKQADEKCSRCNDVKTGATIDALGHNYGDDSVCDACGYDKTAPHTHAYTAENATAEYLKASATCTDRAVYYKSCSCGAKGTDTFESGEALGHDYREVANSATPATCTANGKQADEKCSRCNDVKTGATIDALGHNYGDDSVCDACGYDKTAPHTHAYTAENATAEYLKASATCTDRAVYYKSCSCGAKGTDTFESGEALGHDYQEVANSATPATCTANGKQADEKCSRCNDVKTGAIVDALGHNYGDDNVCDACGYEQTSTTSHDPDDPAVKPNKDKLSGGAIAGIVLGSTAVAGVGGFMILRFVSKKKKPAD